MSIQRESDDFFKIMWDRINTDFLGFMNSYTRNNRIILQDKESGKLKLDKTYTHVISINIDEGYSHSLVIISELGDEYKVLPEEILKFRSNWKSTSPKMSITNMVEGGTIEPHEVKFTETIFIYTDKLTVQKETVRQFFKDKNMTLVIRDDEYRSKLFEKIKPDIFICHDSRDKETFVKPLAVQCSAIGIKIWYDEFSLKWGDNLIDKIDEGLRSCDYGIVVLSKNFMENRPWSHKEFNNLRAKWLATGKNPIRPIWLNVTQNEVSDYNYDLSTMKALNASDGIPHIIEEIKKLLKIPDLSSNK